MQLIVVSCTVQAGDSCATDWSRRVKAAMYLCVTRTKLENCYVFSSFRRTSVDAGIRLWMVWVGGTLYGMRASPM